MVFSLPLETFLDDFVYWKCVAQELGPFASGGAFQLREVLFGEAILMRYESA